MLQPCQFNLQLALPALGALCKDVQNQRGAVQHRNTELALQVALLYWRQRGGQDNDAGARLEQLLSDLLDLAAPEVQRRVRPLASRNDPTCGQEAGALRQLAKLLDVIRSLERASAFATQRNLDQQGLRWRLGSGPLDLESAQDSDSVLRLTGRAGTTVDIACL